MPTPIPSHKARLFPLPQRRSLGWAQQEHRQAHVKTSAAHEEPKSIPGALILPSPWLSSIGELKVSLWDSIRNRRPPPPQQKKEEKEEETKKNKLKVPRSATKSRGRSHILTRAFRDTLHPAQAAKQHRHKRP